MNKYRSIEGVVLSGLDNTRAYSCKTYINLLSIAIAPSISARNFPNAHKPLLVVLILLITAQAVP